MCRCCPSKNQPNVHLLLDNIFFVTPSLQSHQFMRITLLLLFTLTSSNAASYDNETYTEFHERRSGLISHLFSGYDKDVPPISSRGRYSSVIKEPLFVNISLELAQILDVREPVNSVQMTVEYELVWKDARLSWNPTDFYGMEGFYINRERVWKTDVLIYESSLYERNPDVQNVYVIVCSNGQIYSFVTADVTFSCPIDLRSFPFDKQVCNMEFGSIQFDSKEVRVSVSLPDDFDTLRASNGEWVVDEVTTEEVVVIQYDYDYSVGRFTFHFRRTPLTYIITIIIPSFVLTFICVVCLFWSKFSQSDYLDKIGFGFAAILAMCTVLQIAKQSIPKTNQLPLLSIFIMVNLLLLIVAISIVVIGSKPSLFPNFGISKKWLRRLNLKFCVEFRIVCLLVFPLAALINLVILILG